MGPTWPFSLMYGSYDMRHIGFLQVDGGQRDTSGFGASQRHSFYVETGLALGLGDLSRDKGFPVAKELATLCCDMVGSSCVTTQILCRDRGARLWVGSRSQHDFSCHDRGSCWGVVTWILVSQQESCVVE